ncbi:hypothetical protein RB195_026459 [Necator americanus]|uniref:Prolyl 4-hydroxylase alpha subunit domain-containing protein n=1 Tax=Necator americanus TaxID=51031 RepID=A0ABR1EX86_NECAM
MGNVSWCPARRRTRYETPKDAPRLREQDDTPSLSMSRHRQRFVSAQYSRIIVTAASPPTEMKVAIFVIFVAVDATDLEMLKEWKDYELEQCDGPPSTDDFYQCFSYLWNYELVNMELLHSEPPIIAYRDLLPREHVKRFLADVETEQKKSQKDLKGPPYATEITIGLRAKDGARRVFERISRLIPFIDFKNSDPWQVLIFKRNDHFAPRHEYLETSAGEELDAFTKKHGNRFAAFSITLEKPESGGKHVFPITSNTCEMEVGDALLWINVDVDRNKEFSMIHGDCPVKEGTKITATLRIRENGQYLLMSSYPGGFYNYDMIVAPNLQYAGMCME